MESRSADRISFFITIIIVQMSWQPALFSEPHITEISFRGNEHFSSRELLSVLSVHRGDIFTATVADTSSAEILRRYRSDGFFFACVDSAATRFSGDSSSVGLTFFLEEGIQSLVYSFTIDGNTVFPEKGIRTRFETSPGKPLNQAVLEKDIDLLLSDYENAGYPLASVKVDSLRLDSTDRSRLSFALVVNEGPKVILGEIKVTGNTSTKNYVVEREARLGNGEVYNQQKVDRIHHRLERMQIFSSVSEPELFLTLNPAENSSGEHAARLQRVHGGLLINVQEENTNNFDGILGYVPAPSSGTAGYLTGTVLVSMRNLFGTGRAATVHWVRESAVTQELELSYSEPWVAGYPVNAGADFFQRKQDSSYVAARINGDADLLVSDQFSVGGLLRWSSVYPSASLNYFTVFESSELSFGVDIRYDTRDNLWNPTRGVFYSTSYERGTKHISGPERYLSLAPEKNYVEQRVAADLETYVSLAARHIAMLSLHGRQITSNRIEQSDLYQFGGTNTVRGYRENQFYGSRMVWSNLEYRYLTGRASSVAAFFDAGYFSRPADALRGMNGQQEFIYGYGVGMRMETGLGIIRVSYALGKGDTFSTGKIHFGLENSF
ncbi:MAG: BamA/TamA family outer membrane protein [Bacteroidota bacterium]|nr:BamA/TamA family outer membrane protein [Bacteroidota bacterium]